VIANNAVDSGWGHKPDTPISSRLVVMRLVLPVGGAPRHVEYRIDHTFIDRLRQLRTLVPMITSLNVWDNPSAVADFFVDRVQPVVEAEGPADYKPVRRGNAVATYFRA